jgi:hypothetical protein
VRTSRNRSMSEALMFLAIPPPASSASSACMRHTSRVRWLPMSVLRLARRRSALRCGRPRRVGAALGSEGQRSRPRARRWGRSCSTGLWRAPAPAQVTQRGWHVHDGLPGGHQLLGQQVAEPASRLDRPGPGVERLGPRHQLSTGAPPARTLLEMVSASSSNGTTAAFLDRSSLAGRGNRPCRRGTRTLTRSDPAGRVRRDGRLKHLARGPISQQARSRERHRLVSRRWMT